VLAFCLVRPRLPLLLQLAIAQKLKIRSYLIALIEQKKKPHIKAESPFSGFFDPHLKKNRKKYEKKNYKPSFSFNPFPPPW